MGTCIWCRRPTLAEPVEHIIPEGLIGEPTIRTSRPVRGVIADRKLILREDEVCRRCNTRELAPLDARLQDALGILKVFLNSHGTKRGRAARYERPGVYAERRPRGPFIILNAEQHTVTTEEGIAIQPVRKSEQVRLEDVSVSGSIVGMRVLHPFPLTKKIFRAIHKIAFEMLCFQEGPAFVLDPKFDHIRDYVLRGRGCRHLIVKAPGDPQSLTTPSITIERIAGTVDRVVAVRLGLIFQVDLTSDEHVFAGSDDELRQLGFVRIRDDHLGNRLPAR